MTVNLTENLAYLMGLTMPELTFKAELSDSPESEDNSIKIFRGDEELAISIQCGFDYLYLNEYGYDKPGDLNTLWVKQLAEGSYTNPVALALHIREYLNAGA